MCGDYGGYSPRRQGERRNRCGDYVRQSPHGRSSINHLSLDRRSLATRAGQRGINRPSCETGSGSHPHADRCSGHPDHRVDHLVDRRHGRDLLSQPAGLEPEPRPVERRLDRGPKRGRIGLVQREPGARRGDGCRWPAPRVEENKTRIDGTIGRAPAAVTPSLGGRPVDDEGDGAARPHGAVRKNRHRWSSWTLQVERALPPRTVLHSYPPCKSSIRS